jgi:hypothetical protein
MLWFYIRTKEQRDGEKSKINSLEHHYFSADNCEAMNGVVYHILFPSGFAWYKGTARIAWREG